MSPPPQAAPAATVPALTGAHTEVRRLHVLLCGYEVIPLAISLRGADPRLLHAVPITAYLLDTARGWVLFDAGLDEADLRDPERLRSHFLEPGWDPPPVVLPHQETAPQLAALGMGFEDIGTVILSHLHADHTGHLKRLTHARMLVHARERAHAFSDAAGPAWFRSDYDLPGLRFETVEGDREVMPGLTLIETPGHTPGHMSALVELPETGPVVLAADVGDLTENLRDEVLPGEASDHAEALASIRRVNALVERGATLMPTHDPDRLRGLGLAPEGYG
jgi:glyoxylase-like metal-dependent hydrolase (beta-lactamase superfamily II)